MNYEQEINVLKRQVQSLRRQVQQLHEQIEVLATNPFKRWLWFVLQGWRPYRVGRWYGKTDELR